MGWVIKAKGALSSQSKKLAFFWGALDYLKVPSYTIIMTGREVLKKLEAHGWRLKSVNGSHHNMEKNGKKVPIPVHGKKDLGKGLLKAIQRQTGVQL